VSDKDGYNDPNNLLEYLEKYYQEKNKRDWNPKDMEACIVLLCELRKSMLVWRSQNELSSFIVTLEQLASHPVAMP